MFRYPTMAKALMAIAVMSFPGRLTAELKAPFGKLPLGWKVLQSFDASRDQTAAISAKLGGQINKLSNTSVSINERRLQVNIIDCAAPADAEKIHKAVLATKSNPAFCLKLGSSVVEFVGDDIDLAIVAAFELGFKPKPKQAAYKISFQAAPIEKADYMSWNKLYNLFLASDSNPNDPKVKSEISRLCKQFQFANQMTLRTSGTAKTAPTYSLEPNPAAKTPLSDGDITQYTFRNLPVKLDTPYVSVAATLRTAENGFMPTSRRTAPELLRPTEFWPSNDPEVMALADKITVGCNTQQEKVNAILKWLQPGKNIKFAGPVTGSRYGVKTVLNQKFGHCWDFSDCFITLSRALKIPSRQVAGWLYGQDGHIWAEVLYENQGWQQVDPTGGGLVECGIYHVAYLTSEDGRMSILYLAKPRIELFNN